MKEKFAESFESDVKYKPDKELKRDNDFELGDDFQLDEKDAGKGLSEDELKRDSDFELDDDFEVDKDADDADSSDENSEIDNNDETDDEKDKEKYSDSTEKNDAENNKEKSEINGSETSDIPEDKEESKLRDLTDDEKSKIQGDLGWSDSQLKKCQIDENGVIHYRTDNCQREGETLPNGVSYERKTVEYKGYRIEGVFPDFDSKFDVNLPEDQYKAKDYAKICNAELKEAIEKDPGLKEKFTPEQLEDIKNGRTPEGYVWHHNEEPGKIQLVEEKKHDRTQGGAAHTGGSAIWGPDSTGGAAKGEKF